MEQILILATVIAPIATGLVQAVKKSINIKKEYMPMIAVVIGLALGAASFPFADIGLAERLWAGGVSGLSSVGLFELGKKKKIEVEDNE
ncbi:holin [Salipaludibacillus sp. CF4.18]|uniref:holin n=1 Tax=Salipaludibacillus sp. CF4.18 TaxID=3373081 RepID=UPI003EE5765C